MKLKALSFFLLTVLLTAAPHSFAEDQLSVAGKWQVHSSTAGTETDSVCTFSQNGGDLTGSCNDDQNGEKKITGKVDGKKVSWTFKSDYNGTPLTVNYEGTLDGEKIAGTLTVPEFSVEGEFKATKSK